MNTHEAVARFLEAQSHISPGTHEIYNRELTKFANIIDELDELDREALGRYTKYLQKNHNSGGVTHSLRCLKVFLKFAKEEGWTDVGTSSVRTPKRPHPKKEIIEEDEFILMLDECKLIRDKLILSILWDTGIRVSELCDIKIKDLFTGGAEIIRLKSYKRDSVYFGHYTDKYLPLWLAEHPGECEYLFISYRCNKLSSRDIQRIVKTVSHMLDKTITPHSFRHTLAWRILQGGGELIDVQNALGHADPMITQRSYMNWIGDRQRSRIQKTLNVGYDDNNERFSRKNKAQPTTARSLQFVGQVS